ncbi:class A basic helix-loop-helix protein 15 isoform 1-T1 [Odontesthes bonariensis]|uniref:class A basic helix-loop-helix protein 15 isoform X1 n=1 Tax=Odontesthes bonariensis TaxID=219752 RepID=UPI003F58F735
MFSLSLSVSSMSSRSCGHSCGVTGAHRMQGRNYFRGGATLVISVNELNWQFKTRCSGRGVKQRDENLHMSMTPRQMIQTDERQQPVTCFCILDQKGIATLRSRRNADGGSNSQIKSSSFSFSPQHCRSLNDNIKQSTFTFLDPTVKDFLETKTWTGPPSHIRDIFSLITSNLNVVTQQDSITMDTIYRFIICFEDCIPAQLFSDTYPSQHWKTFNGHTDNKNMSIIKHTTTQRPFESIPSSEDVGSETSNTQNLGNHLKSHQNNNPKEALGKDGNVKMRKSVSFDEDVLVYLFDQESPTVELHSEHCILSPCSCSGTPPEVPSEDAGLQWEDDFWALDNNTSHFQYGRHSHTLSLPTWGWSALSRPERWSLSQTCLFLTYVTESDLEL